MVRYFLISNHDAQMMTSRRNIAIYLYPPLNPFQVYAVDTWAQSRGISSWKLSKILIQKRKFDLAIFTSQEMQKRCYEL